jgi:chromatin remodeling complex protein RSC6
MDQLIKKLLVHETYSDFKLNDVIGKNILLFYFNLALTPHITKEKLRRRSRPVKGRRCASR